MAGDPDHVVVVALSFAVRDAALDPDPGGDVALQVKTAPHRRDELVVDRHHVGLRAEVPPGVGDDLGQARARPLDPFPGARDVVEHRSGGFLIKRGQLHRRAPECLD